MAGNLVRHSLMSFPTGDILNLIASKLGRTFEGSILQRTVGGHGRLTAQLELCCFVDSGNHSPLDELRAGTPGFGCPLGEKSRSPQSPDLTMERWICQSLTCSLRPTLIHFLGLPSQLASHVQRGTSADTASLPSRKVDRDLQSCCVGKPPDQPEPCSYGYMENSSISYPPLWGICVVPSSRDCA
ncbi:hypothetical protein K466DRAFT_565407 [Polyporus arcularius HHB13444]|uniref:Uncharacterized protein n=1 Tax=Polyporus arcularius HHB13444 TaxID=1314778 RepID=A0A5C3PN47_9APHY|nr:hypothetical protein K466DRAFT_565407 [Polyporus arcularius HHB13444]